MSRPNEQPPQGMRMAQPAPSEPSPYPINFYVEEPSGDVHSAEALSSTQVGEMAAEFFEMRQWPTTDQSGRRQRAVVERVDPEYPERTDRLNPNDTLHAAGVRDGDTLRVLPQAVAGAVNPHERLRALVVDQREVRALVETDPAHLTVEMNADHAPTHYALTFRYTGVKYGDRGPELINEHRVEIFLPAEYPLGAPVVRWLTPIFHPNISVRGDVCLGVLAERYLPGLGLAYIVRMLMDIVRYRNYDLHGVYNRDAATWARSAGGQETILALGGLPEEQPLDVLITQVAHRVHDEGRPRTRFTRVNRFDEDE